MSVYIRDTKHEHGKATKGFTLDSVCRRKGSVCVWGERVCVYVCAVCVCVGGCVCGVCVEGVG